MLPESLLEASTKIVYSVALSGDLKVYWSRLLTFSFQSVNVSQAHLLEITAASRPFSDLEDVKRSFTNLSLESQSWIIASLNLLLERASAINDWISHRNLETLITHLSSEANSREETIAQLRSEFHAYENRKTFIVQGSIGLISLDYFLRWALLVIGNFNKLSPDTIFGLNFGVTLLVLPVAFWQFKRNRKHNEALISKSGFSSMFKVKFRFETFQYTTIGFYLISSIIVSFLIFVEGSTAVYIAFTLILILYYLLLLLFFPVGRLTEHSILQQLHSEQQKSVFDSDDNDAAIVMIETQLNSSTGRLEAYVLESALFGALAFSGFLQIVATDLISFADLENFALKVHRTAQSLVLAKWSEFYSFSNQLNTKVNLFCLVSIETLVCSALFLAVIASRLRFSDVADKVRTSLNLAKAYNEKEEALLENHLTNENSVSRLAAINKRINDHLTEAQRHMNGVEPIVSYMVYFRNAGLISFLAVLVSSSLFVTSLLGWSFAGIAVATWVYFNQKKIRSRLVSFGLSFRIFFVHYSTLLFLLALFPGILAFFLSTVLEWTHTDYLLALSYALTGVYFFVWLVSMPHPDKRFGDIENLQNEMWRTSSWKLIKYAYGIIILVSFVGLFFKIHRLAGASEILMIGLSAMSLMNYFIGFYLTRPKWLGFLMAQILGICGIGFLFKMLHLTGGEQMALLGSLAAPIFFVLYLLRRRSFHYILFRLFLVYSIVALSITSWGSRPALWRRVQLMYEHRTLSLTQVFSIAKNLQFDLDDLKKHPHNFDKSIRACDKYIETYGTRFGRTEVYAAMIGNYIWVSNQILSSEKDTTLLNVALKAAHQANKINTLFGDTDTDWILELRALKALGKKEEATAFLQNILQQNPNPDTQKTAKAELDKLKRI